MASKAQLGVSRIRTCSCRLIGKARCIVSSSWVSTVLSIPDLDEFARVEGFKDFDHMKQWFRDTHGLPFIGQFNHPLHE